jgi:hypothetical protein
MENSVPFDIRNAYLYLREKGYPVDAQTAAIAIRTAGNYATIKDTFQNEIRLACFNYMKGTDNKRSAKATCKRAIKTGFMDAFESGYIDASGEGGYDADPQDTEFLASKIAENQGYIDGVFVTMDELLASASVEEPFTEEDMSGFSVDRADGYGRTLDGIYAQGMLRGRKNIMLTLDGPDGNESCKTCQRYKGQRHRAKWWVSRDLIPTPGNENYECGCYRCEHRLYDDDSNVWAGALA